MRFSVFDLLTGVELAVALGEKLVEVPRHFADKFRRRDATDSAMLPDDPDRIVPVSGAAAHDLLVGTKRDEVCLVISTGMLAISTLGLPLLPLLGATANLYLLLPVFKRGFARLWNERKFTNDLLVIIVNSLLFVTGHFVLFSLATIVYFLGSWIQYRARIRSVIEISGLFSTMPAKVWLLVDGVAVEVPLEKVRSGDRLVVHPTEIIPADGIIEEGACQIDQRTLTGEFQYAEKNVGDQVFASTMVVSGVIICRVVKAGNDVLASQLNRILLQSVAGKTRLNMLGEEWADRTALPIIVLGSVVAASGAVMHAIIIFKFAIGNTIRIACPLSTLNYMTILTRQGILIKNAQDLEKLPEVDTILFDKTGTVTEDRPVVREVVVLGKTDIATVVQLAAMAEKRMKHPIAEAILDKATEMGLEVPDIADRNYTVSMGITVKHGRSTILVGSCRFMESCGVSLTAHSVMLDAFMSNGYNVVVVTRNSKPLGCLVLEETLRPEIARQVAALRQRGIRHIGLVSGDQEHAAQRIAERLGFDTCYHSVMPEQKAEIVKTLQQQGRTVCFVGDGINDAIALKQADASISFSGASTAASDSSGIILLSGGFESLDSLFRIAAQMKSNLQQTLALAVIPTAANMAGLLFVPEYSVLSAILVKLAGRSAAIGNAMYPLWRYQKQQESTSCSAPLPESVSSTEVLTASRPVETTTSQSVTMYHDW